MPGRYEHNRDPQLPQLLHHVTEEGWGNDSVGDLDQDGFHASLLIIEPTERQELTEAFDHDIPAGSWIVTEDQQGFVILDQYPTPAAARYAAPHGSIARSAPYGRPLHSPEGGHAMGVAVKRQ